MTHELLAQRIVGSRTVAGTDWPVVDQLHRTGPREWTITRELCDRVSGGHETYASEAAARNAWARKPGPKPRGGAAARNLTLRATAEEIARWQAAAERDGVTLAEWLRRAADRAA